MRPDFVWVKEQRDVPINSALSPDEVKVSGTLFTHYDLPLNVFGGRSLKEKKVPDTFSCSSVDFVAIK
jgi:hypothetical protein